ncbi:MAG: SprB repeat-containing protein [Bacteroidetes bacterium]|nr:SprB repeat-containing protein [Bacteroidota bacterium]
MKKTLLLVFALVLFRISAQPILTYSLTYAEEVAALAFDSTNNKTFYNVGQGCAVWNAPCALSYTPAMSNLINKYDFSDNNFSSIMNSNLVVGAATHALKNFNSSIAKQSLFQESSIYTNLGYFFSRIDTTNLSPIWTYSTNTGVKEVSTFEIKNDSLFLFERDSSSGKNYYTVILKNKSTGFNLPYTSLIQSNPGNIQGAIQGYISNSALINNKIVLSGIFSASVSASYIARNLVVFDIASGQLQAPPSAFLSNTVVHDMVHLNNKIYLAGLFSSINGQTRKNFAVLDNNLNLLADTVQFTGLGAPSTVWLDKIVFYDKYLIAKGNFNKIDNTVVSATNTFSVRVINTANNTVMPWTINLPTGSIGANGYTFHTIKNKLYIKKRGNPSPLYIYCFEPISYSQNILFPGSNPSNPSPSIALCAPDNGNSNVFTAPVKYATIYNWNFSGSNATVVPISDGKTAKLVIAANATSGILTVTGSNDCGLTSSSATLNITVNQKPPFNLPISPQLIICNPDSTLLQATSINPTTILWRKNLASVYKPQPFYVKTSGNYYMIITDNANGCKDSGLVIVNNDKALPNVKITSHTYPGVSIPIDTVTCFSPLVNIVAASDTSGVSISWKSIATNSIFSNPLTISGQNNLKVIVNRNSNNCVDSSLIVLVGQDNAKPIMSLNNTSPSINCSIYSASITAVYSPTNCNALWSGPLSYTSANPATISNVGKYYISISNSLNGCSKLDSVLLTYNNTLLLKSSNDSVICKQASLVLNSVAVGTLSGINYSWSSGQNSNTINVNPLLSTNYIIIANGPGGCVGKDTIKINVPTDIKDSIITYKNCNNNNTGTILMYAKGGIPPYKYSINNGTSFTFANAFTNIPFGNYNLIIQDSIGCVKTNTISLNISGNLPVPKFLASTQNFKSDTIILVDISIPKADSVQWVLPNQASIIGGTMFNPMIFLNDTGQFLVTMKAYYGNCIINATKQISFALADSLHATNANANGIKTFSLYPNPNTGQFTVFVEFYKKQNVSIQAWDQSPYKHFQQNFYDTNSITLPIDLSQLINGTYVLRVIGEYDAKNKIFIINH